MGTGCTLASVGERKEKSAVYLVKYIETNNMNVKNVQ
jgi:hypothetical protein